MAPMVRLLQANINHCAGAQDLLMQSLAEWNIELAVVSEPYTVPNRHNWLGDILDSVTIVGGTAINAPSLSILARGEGYVVADWGGTKVVGVYFPPRRPRVELEEILEEVSTVILGCSPNPTVDDGGL